MKLTKALLKQFYIIYKAIKSTEEGIISPKYIEWGFVSFEALREEFWVLYEMYDDDEYPILDCLVSIMQEWETFDFSKLTKEEEEGLTEDWTLFILKRDEHLYPHCIKKIESIDEWIDYLMK